MADVGPEDTPEKIDTLPPSSLKAARKAAKEDSLEEIGKDALSPLLETVRDVFKSDSFQKRLVKEVNEHINVPMVPEAIEGTMFSSLYDVIENAVVGALERWIGELKESEG